MAFEFFMVKKEQNYREASEEQEEIIIIFHLHKCLFQLKILIAL